MARFLFVYRGTNGGPTELSPEQMQEQMKKWMAWIEGGQKAGWLVAPGDALLPSGKVVQTDLTVSDGPYAETKELVGGYSIVEADTIEAACELAKTSPAPAAGDSVEVREVANLDLDF